MYSILLTFFLQLSPDWHKFCSNSVTGLQPALMPFWLLSHGFAAVKLIEHLLHTFHHVPLLVCICNDPCGFQCSEQLMLWPKTCISASVRSVVFGEVQGFHCWLATIKAKRVFFNSMFFVWIGHVFLEIYSCYLYFRGSTSTDCWPCSPLWRHVDRYLIKG